MSIKDIVYGNLEEAAKVAAKQNFDHDVLSGGVQAEQWNFPDVQASYLEEAFDVLKEEGENYFPKYPHFQHVKYRPVESI